MRKTAYLRGLCCALLCCLIGVLLLVAVPVPGTAAQKPLVVGVMEDPPYLIKQPNGEWTGLCVDIWKRVAGDLKYDYVLREMSLNDLLTSVQADSLDIALEAFFVTSERERVIDYSFPFGTARLAVAVPVDKAPHPWWTAIKVFFSWGTMKVIVVFCLILVLLGAVFWAIERKANPDHFGGGLKGLGSGVYWVGSTLASGVCFGIHLKSFTARALGLLWMMLCAVALSALIASLSASLSAERMTSRAVSDETLRRMLLAGIKGSAELATVKGLGARYVLFNEETEALDALVQGKVDGFLYDEITLNYYRDNDYRGRISVHPAGGKRFSFGFIFPKGSPLRTKINLALITLMEGPEWKNLLMRYGLKENFEQIEAPLLGKRGSPSS